MKLYYEANFAAMQMYMGERTRIFVLLMLVVQSFSFLEKLMASAQITFKVLEIYLIKKRNNGISHSDQTNKTRIQGNYTLTKEWILSQFLGGSPYHFSLDQSKDVLKKCWYYSDLKANLKGIQHLFKDVALCFVSPRHDVLSLFVCQSKLLCIHDSQLLLHQVYLY